jgi:hypothetical protein
MSVNYAIGDIVNKTLSCSRAGVRHTVTTGRIIYINWRHGWYTAEFEMPDGSKVCESYFMKSLTPKPPRPSEKSRTAKHGDADAAANTVLEEDIQWLNDLMNI